MKKFKEYFVLFNIVFGLLGSGFMIYNFYKLNNLPPDVSSFLTLEEYNMLYKSQKHSGGYILNNKENKEILTSLWLESDKKPGSYKIGEDRTDITLSIVGIVCIFSFFVMIVVMYNMKHNQGNVKKILSSTFLVLNFLIAAVLISQERWLRSEIYFSPQPNQCSSLDEKIELFNIVWKYKVLNHF